MIQVSHIAICVVVLRAPPLPPQKNAKARVKFFCSQVKYTPAKIETT